MHEYDDVQGQAHTLEQRREDQFGNPDLPDPRNFDVEFSSSGLVLQLTTRTTSGGFHRSERFVYGDAGELLRSVITNRSGVESEITDFIRESDERQIWTTRDFSGVVVGNGVTQYSNGLAVRSTSFRSGAMSVDKRIEYVKGKLSKRVSEYYGFNGALSERWIAIFNESERVIENFGLKADGRPLGDGKYVYEYDSAGRTYRVLSFNDLADENIPNYIRGFTYVCDEKGNWIERREYSLFRDDGRWQQSITTRRLSYHE